MRAVLARFACWARVIGGETGFFETERQTQRNPTLLEWTFRRAETRALGCATANIEQDSDRAMTPESMTPETTTRTPRR